MAESKAAVAGVLYGATIYAFMHLIVLPLSAAPAFKTSVIASASDFAVHLLLIGPAIAFATQRYAPVLAAITPR